MPEESDFHVPPAEIAVGVHHAAPAVFVPGVPSPSCPELSNPQHRIAPLDESPHVYWLPAATDVQTVIPVTIDGADLWEKVASPSWPKSLFPQQYAVPVVVTAQVWFAPAEINKKDLPAMLASAGTVRFDALTEPSPT